MKAYLIKASANSNFKRYKQYMGAPPQSIFSVAAVTPDWVDLHLLDETSQAPASLDFRGDLVAVFASTPDVLRAYQLADHFRQQNITVVIGGLHASFMPEEAQQHADAVMIGEAEHVWPQLLQDFRDGALKTVYQSQQPTSMLAMQPYPYGDIDLSPYDGVGSVMVSRGCKFKCDFCTVNQFFQGLHQRPVAEVVDEIRCSGVKYLELHADNLIADRDYAMELFTALKPLNIRWVAEATLNIADHDDLLQAAAESGLFYLLVGLETSSQAALKASGKGFVRLDRAKEHIAKLHEYNIAVDSAMIFGFDQHDADIFQHSLDFVEQVELDVCHGVILTPFPGTQLFNRLDREGRILTRDWSKYDCDHIVFQPKQMSAETLMQGAQWFYQEYHSLMRSSKRQFVKARNLGWFNSLYF